MLLLCRSPTPLAMLHVRLRENRLGRQKFFVASPMCPIRCGEPVELFPVCFLSRPRAAERLRAGKLSFHRAKPLPPALSRTLSPPQASLCTEPPETLGVASTVLHWIRSLVAKTPLLALAIIPKSSPMPTV